MTHPSNERGDEWQNVAYIRPPKSAISSSHSHLAMQSAMSGWTTPSPSNHACIEHYKTFHPDDSGGFSRLIELIVFLHQRPMSIRYLMGIIHDINDGIHHSE